MKKTLKEKTKLLAKEKCCYVCYQPMSKYQNVKNCTNRLAERAELARRITEVECMSIMSGNVRMEKMET